MTSERTAEDRYPLPWTCPHGIDGRNCVKCADAYQRVRSGAQNLVIDEAARMESKQTRAASERTADADVATLHRFHVERERWLDKEADLAWTRVADRLSPAEQQVQEIRETIRDFRLGHISWIQCLLKMDAVFIGSADAHYQRVRSGAQNLVIDEAARMESKQTRAASERTADAENREGIVTVRGDGLAYLGCMGVETWQWLLAHPELDAPALDRLVARNQQLQEALDKATDAADTYGTELHALRWMLGLETHEGEERQSIEESVRNLENLYAAALASVRARTPA